MSITEILKTYLLTTPVFLGIDAFWLGVIAKNFYQQRIGDLIRTPINWLPALVFYLLFPLGIILFAVKGRNNWQEVLLFGALFGFYTYATYDLTNLATLKGWPLTVTVVDILWGSFIATVTAGVAYWISTNA
ncbi:MAG: DUF2177 family protein [Patescibacteria group bacterium]